MNDIPWLIWSNEHRAWWAPRECGYVHRREDAGRYSLERAREICRQANAYLPGTPNETMVADEQ